jgi:phage shock protein PspC (stress-responsive transcriptional regulator)
MPEEQMMQNVQPSLLARDDTFFGICQGLGEDFGFHPNFLRLAFSLLLFFNPLAAIGGYLAAGVIVLLSRLLAPAPRLAPATDAHPVSAEPASHRVALESDLEPVALAA